ARDVRSHVRRLPGRKADAAEAAAGLQTSNEEGVLASHVPRHAARQRHRALLAPPAVDARPGRRQPARVERAMPLYEYECDACGHRFEIIRKFSDPPVEKCPVCKGGVHKLQSAPAFHLKGSGWYITDYAKKDQAGAKAEDGSTDTKDAKDTKRT